MVLTNRMTIRGRRLQSILAVCIVLQTIRTLFPRHDSFEDHFDISNHENMFGFQFLQLQEFILDSNGHTNSSYVNHSIQQQNQTTTNADNTKIKTEKQQVNNEKINDKSTFKIRNNSNSNKPIQITSSMVETTAKKTAKGNIKDEKEYKNSSMGTNPRNEDVIISNSSTGSINRQSDSYEYLSNVNMPLNNPPIIHNVKTRFMQRQPDLIALGKARLKLFETFCLPTMVGQTTNNFVWLIRTDPNLHPDLLIELKRMLEPYTNRFFLLLDNHNNVNLRDLNVKKIRLVSGNITALDDAIQMSKQRTLVETRLDADDGFHTKFIERVQMKALASSYVQGKNNWRVFCAHTMVNWYTGHLTDKKVKQSTGFLDSEHSVDICITPGLTYVLPPKVTQHPELGHQKIKLSIPQCEEVSDEVASALFIHYQTMPLLSESSANVVANAINTTTGSLSYLIATNNFNSKVKKSVKLPNLQAENCMDDIKYDWPQVVRARTPTSHGMKDVLSKPNENNQNQLWDVLYSGFHILKSDALSTIDKFRQNLNEIVQDNLKGQCTLGHSCKDISKSHLKWIANKLRKQNKKK